ncbi:MAG: O-antigen ligase family protein [Actinomycetota bacterium]|nr:O-antigen ligase family protein [Actinomycetota bacterium]
MTDQQALPRADHWPSMTSRLTFVLAVLAVLAVALETAWTVGLEGFGAGAMLRLAGVVGVLTAALWLGRFEWFLLVVLVTRPVLDVVKAAGDSPVVASAVAGLLVLGAAFWLAAQARAGALLAPSAVTLCSVGLLAVMTLSSAFADDRVRSVLQVARLAAAVAVLAVVEQLATDPAKRRRLMTAVFLSALVPLTVAFVQQATGNFAKTSSNLGRVTGTFLHPNALGFYLVLLLLLGMSVYRYVEGRLRLLVSVVMVAGTLGLLLTYSRGSWVAFVAGVVVVGLLQSRKLLLLLPAGLALIPVVAPSVLQRLADLQQQETLSGTPGNSFFWRIDHWRRLLGETAGQELLGVGPGGADFLGDEVLPPHNDFVRMYVETGFLGLVAYVALLVLVAVLLRRALTDPRVTGLSRGIVVGTAASSAAFVVASIGGNLISQLVILLYFFTFLGLASAVLREVQAPAPVPPDPEVPATAKPLLRLSR